MNAVRVLGGLSVQPCREQASDVHKALCGTGVLAIQAQIGTDISSVAKDEGQKSSRTQRAQWRARRGCQSRRRRPRDQEHARTAAGLMCCYREVGGGGAQHYRLVRCNIWRRCNHWQCKAAAITGKVPAAKHVVECRRPRSHCCLKSAPGCCARLLCHAQPGNCDAGSAQASIDSHTCGISVVQCDLHHKGEPHNIYDRTAK